MKARMMIALLLAGVALLGLSGCHGPAPALDPVITWDFGEPEEGQLALPYMHSGGVLFVKGEAAVEDSSGNPITSYHWTQTPAVGTFTSTDSLETTWAAPVLAPGDPEKRVRLTLTVETLLGGHTVKNIDLIVIP